MRARLALRLAKIEVQIQEIDLRNRPPELYAASSKGTVPVLVLNDGTVIEESIEIVRWALGGSEKDYALIKRCDGEFKQHLDRYKYSTRYENVDPQFHRQQGSLFIEHLNDELGKADYLAGNEFGIPDLCIAPFIRQFRAADVKWLDEQPWPALHNWLQRYLESNDFKAIMVKAIP